MQSIATYASKALGYVVSKVPASVWDFLLGAEAEEMKGYKARTQPNRKYEDG